MKSLLIISLVFFLFFNLGCKKNESSKSNSNTKDFNISFDTTGSTDSLITCESLVDITPLLEPFLLENYREKKPLEIGYRNLIFSPDGKFLAICTSRIGSDQVWILDINNTRLKPATEKSTNDKIKLHVTSIAWLTNDTLIVNIEANKSYIRFRSTIDAYVFEKIPQRSFIESLNRVSPSGRYEVIFPNRQTVTLRDLKNKRTKILTDTSMNWWDKSIYLSWSPLDRFFLFNLNHGHGDLSLYVGTTEQKFKIIELARGTWVDYFAVSPLSEDVAFVNDAHCIKIYNLESFEIRKKIQTGVFPGHIAWSTQNFLAFTANYCQESLDTLRKKNGYLPLGNRRLYLVKL